MIKQPREHKTHGEAIAEEMREIYPDTDITAEMVDRILCAFNRRWHQEEQKEHRREARLRRTTT
jgi:hypothetical protein